MITAITKIFSAYFLHYRAPKTTIAECKAYLTGAEDLQIVLWGLNPTYEGRGYAFILLPLRLPFSLGQRTEPFRFPAGVKHYIMGPTETFLLKVLRNFYGA